MIVFDAHLDLAWNAVEWNRNLEWPVAEIREFESQFPGTVPGDCMVSLPALQQGRFGVVIATLLSRLHRLEKPRTFYQSDEAAYGAAQGQLAWYRAMATKGCLRLLTTSAELAAHAGDWMQFDQGSHDTPPPVGCILSMEGAWPILAPAHVAEWYEAGLRLVGPAHYGPNRYCQGTGSTGGLTAAGRDLLREMRRVGLLLDVTHLADQSFWEALDVYDGPLIASHHNCRALVPGDRQLTDDQICAVIERGGVIGAAFDNWMLTPGWKKYETPLETVTLANVADQIDHVCQLAGNARHSGLGTDLDGGFGREQSPSDLESISDVQNLAEILRRRGYPAEDIEGILFRNFAGFLARHLP